jgi:hypothetical protein
MSMYFVQLRIAIAQLLFLQSEDPEKRRYKTIY